MRRIALPVLLCFIAAAAAAAPADETWMSVTLDGRKIGYMHTVREVRADRVVTAQTMDIGLERAGMKLGVVTTETSEETLAGEPLALSSRAQLSGIETKIEGTIRGDKIEVTSEVGGQKTTRVQDWPKNARLAEGLRLHAQREGLKPGTRYSDLAYQPSSLDAMEVTTEVGKPERVDLPGGMQTLPVLHQVIKLPGMPTASTAWVGADQEPRKLVMNVLGFKLEMLACDRACATAPNQPADMLAHSMMHAPRAPAANELRDSGIAYTLRATDGGTLDLPDTDEQHAERAGKDLRLVVRPQAKSKLPAPVAADRAPNDWLQSSAPEIVALAKEAAGDASTDLERMRHLETFVRGYITHKNLGVGYASALEVLKTREGDCTEHAVLLAALGRALNVPTRVVDGLAYTGSFAGAQNVFVPHAWVQAWVDGRWQSFDAALNGFDAGHIALSVGDGDPWRFFAGIGTLGRMRLDTFSAAGAAK